MTEERKAEIKKILETDDTAIYFQQLKKGDNVTWGQGMAYRAWENSLENDTSMFEVHELPWGNNVTEEMRDFVDTLRAAGVDRFAVTDESTALMSSLHTLIAAGGILEGPCTVTRRPPYWDEETRLGLEIRIA